MPYGTASARLRKSIMFLLAQKSGMDTCCRCHEPIESVDDFSIEHLEPWESSNRPDLFFDLDNIGFSHRKCNVPFVRRSWEGRHYEQVGELSPRAKLSNRQATSIREQAGNGISHHSLARDYGVNRSVISRIVSGERYMPG